jgi:mono/diheme cytochrome c family protein
MASRTADVKRLLAATLLFTSACSGGGDDPQLSDLANQGRRVYQNVCITCHNGDPTLDGALGPAIAGSSRELLEAKVLRGEYPPGYAPKRAGSITMPRFDFLADQIDALAAYLEPRSS